MMDRIKLLKKQAYKRWFDKNRKECAAKSKRWREANPDKAPKFKSNGFTLKLFNEALEKQEGKCAICGNELAKRRTHADHCHATGRPRGVLCNKCNMGLGMFDDKRGLLEAAIIYLEAHTP